MSSPARAVIVTLTMLGACATATPEGESGPDARRVDARAIDAPAIDAPAIDAPAIDAPAIDAPAIDAPAIDAPAIDAPAPIDASTMIDAACTPVTMQLLLNPSFDATPIGTGWVQTPVDPMFPLITPDDGVAEHTAPNKLWMGGILDGDDEAYQNVTIPAGTNRLVLRGQLDIRSDEFFPGVYDHSTVALTTTANVVLETVLANDDDDETTGWTPFQKIFAQAYAGQTVRVRVRSDNDGSDATSFFYDTLVLEATICP